MKSYVRIFFFSLFSSLSFFVLYFKFLSLEVREPMDEVFIWFLGLSLLFLTLGLTSNSLCYFPVAIFNSLFIIYYSYYGSYFFILAYIGFTVEAYSWYSSISIL